MKHTNLTRRLLTAGTIALAAVSIAQTAHAKTEAPDVPTRIAVGAGNKVFLVGHAVGVQIYSCNAAGGGYTWGLVAPRANLYGDNGKLLATHYAGPRWETRDGSVVSASRVDGVTVDPTAIPWLLLAATPAAGSEGDRLAETTFIQRTATTGGLAPAASACNAGTVGTQQEIPYTADYHFWKSTGS